MLYLFNNGKGATAFISRAEDFTVRRADDNIQSSDPDAPFVAFIDGSPVPAWTGHSVTVFTDSGHDIASFDYQGEL